MTVSIEEQHAAAVIAAINALSGAAYDLDDIKALATTPTSYNEVTVSRVFAGVPRLSADMGTTSWRITSRAVAKTVTNAREMRGRATLALENARLTIAGETTTPIQFETDEGIGEDNEWFSGLTAWTYTHG